MKNALQPYFNITFEPIYYRPNARHIGIFRPTHLFCIGRLEFYLKSINSNTFCNTDKKFKFVFLQRHFNYNNRIAIVHGKQILNKPRTRK